MSLFNVSIFLKFKLYFNLFQITNSNHSIYVNETISTDLEYSQDILENPRIGFYQSVYGWAVIFVITFTYVNSFTYMKVNIVFIKQGLPS